MSRRIIGKMGRGKSANLRISQLSRLAQLPDGRTMKYGEYIVSPEWRSQHAKFLFRGGYRCSFMPWVKIGKGKRYACHHMNYDRLGREAYGRDIIVLCPWVHMMVAHGILAGFKSASKQRSPYPNKAQKLFHFFCRLPLFLKWVAWVDFIVLVVGGPITLASYFWPDLGVGLAIGAACLVILLVKFSRK